MSGPRNEDGTFQAGQSGNPAGRPPRSEEQKENARAIKELAKEMTADLFKVVVEIAKNPKAPVGQRLKAATYLLNQAWGAPTPAPQNIPQGTLQTVTLSVMTPEQIAEARAKAAAADNASDVPQAD